MIDIIIWIAVIAAIIFGFYAYIMLPSKCPYCKTRMRYESRARNGKVVSSEVCPNCGYEIELDYE